MGVAAALMLAFAASAWRQRPRLEVYRILGTRRDPADGTTRVPGRGAAPRATRAISPHGPASAHARNRYDRSSRRLREPDDLRSLGSREPTPARCTKHSVRGGWPPITSPAEPVGAEPRPRPPPARGWRPHECDPSRATARSRSLPARSDCGPYSSAAVAAAPATRPPRCPHREIPGIVMLMTTLRATTASTGAGLRRSLMRITAWAPEQSEDRTGRAGGDGPGLQQHHRGGTAEDRDHVHATGSGHAREPVRCRGR